MPQLTRLWAAMLTRSQKDDGTNDAIVLTANQNGTDALHWTLRKPKFAYGVDWLGGPQYEVRGQQRGEADIYSLDLQQTDGPHPAVRQPLIPDSLSDSSFRVAIRGRDLWRPEHFFVWAEAGIPTSLAIETDLELTLSADPDEGDTSFPLRLLGPAAPSQAFTRVLVLVSTGFGTDDGTASPVRLDIIRNGLPLLDYTLPDVPGRLQRGHDNLFFHPLLAPFTKRDVKEGGWSIRLTILGRDAWHPRSFFLFGVFPQQGRPQFVQPVVHLPEWPFGRMSVDSSEGSAVVELPLL